MGLNSTEQKKVNNQRDAYVRAGKQVEKIAYQVKCACNYQMPTMSSRVDSLDDAFLDFCTESDAYNSLLQSYSVLPDSETAQVLGLHPCDYFSKIRCDYYDRAREEYQHFMDEHVVFSERGNSTPHRVGPLTYSPNVSRNLRDLSNVTRTSSSGFSSSAISYKREDLPKLPDNPTPMEWSEWCGRWETSVVPHYGGDLMGLAQATRDHAGKSGRLEISHISISEPQAYENMMVALKARFNNTSFNVFSVMSELARLKCVRDGDPRGLQSLFRKIISAHAQLKQLGHVDKVDYMKMNQVVRLLPATYQEAWAAVYSEFDTGTRCAPFDKFVAFLNGKSKVLQELVDSRFAHDLEDRNASSGSRTPNARSRVNQVEVHASSVEPSCVFHPHGNHSLVDCREFTLRSPKERADLCHEHRLCARCLTQKHDKECPIPYQPCSKCDKPDRPASHCDPLCYAGQKRIEKSYGKTTHRSFNPPSNKSEKDVRPSSGRSYGVSSQGESGTPASLVPAVTSGHPGEHCTHTSYAVDSSVGESTQVVPAPRTPTSSPGCGTCSSDTSCCHSSHTACNATQVLALQPCGGGRPSTPRNVSHGSRPPMDGVTSGRGHAQALALKDSSSGKHCPSSCYGGGLPLTDAPSTCMGASGCASQSGNKVGTCGLRAVFHTAFTSQICGDACAEPSLLEEPMDTSDVGVRAHVAKCKNTFNKVPGVYAIGTAQVPHTDSRAVIFFDPGSDVTCFDADGVEALRPRVLDVGTLNMTTVNHKSAISTKLVEVALNTRDGLTVTITGYTLPRLCGDPYQLDEKVLSDSFPSFDAATLQRPSAKVNVLLGADYFGYFPKVELASNGHLSIMRGVLTTCVVGSHPDLVSSNPVNNYAGYSLTFSSYSISGPRTDTPLLSASSPPPSPPSGRRGSTSPDPPVDDVPGLSYDSDDDDDTGVHPTMVTASAGTDMPTLCRRRSLIDGPASVAYRSFAVGAEQAAAVDRFVLGEELGTSVKPRCGACRCGKCPVPGQSFSFKEEQELDLIQSKLRYVPDEKYWITGYPWLIDPSTLPNNYAAAYSTLCRTEKTLARDPSWSATYQAQIEDHVSRGVARKLTPEEIRSWKGPVFYLAHMAIEQPKSESTPVRLVFNSSQTYKGISLNGCLAKGPDCYNNTLLGSLIRMREFPVLMIGDIRKMYNTVRLEPLEQQMHRFLWRECNSDKEPDIYVITRVNLGDRPSGTIAITAKNNTAHMFSHICPEAAQVLIYCCYTDDLINSILRSFAHALWLAEKIDEILAQGDFKVKKWLFAGLGVPAEYLPPGPLQLLGAHYRATDDSLFFPVKLNFSPRRRKVPTGPNLTVKDLPDGIPSELTRRIVLAQVMSIYDPLGLLCPLVLQAKILLRRTWELELGWDVCLPDHMVSDWYIFFTSLFAAEEVPFARSLTPEDAVGSPQLCLFSDGSEIAYGCAGYIRWKLKDGSYWCRLIMAKSRIAPISRINIPQMELNGAVVAKRLRQAILSETRLEFEKVFHFVDSETVLHQISRIAQRFGVYEGVRIGEIQSATGGDMSDWNWIPGTLNVGDLTTKPRGPEELGPTSEWQCGPAFLRDDESTWPVKPCSTVPNERAPGEKYYSFAANTRSAPPGDQDMLNASLTRCTQFKITSGAFARIISALRAKSFKGGRSSLITPEARSRAFNLIVGIAQRSAWPDPESIRSQHRQINPVRNQHGLWVSGTRIRSTNAVFPESSPPIILPRHHLLTQRLMEESHVNGRHTGRDPTLARFRTRFTTSKAGPLAASVCKHCQRCKLLKVKLLQQKMGALPPERLRPAPVFCYSVLDLFGPYYVKAENQKRTLMKVWGVIFVCLPSRAVHIDVTSGYDTRSFLVALSRFTALRGWPSIIYSDPGTQLVGASKEVRELWDSIRQGEDELSVMSRHGCQWIFGPADSPWYQGSAEALIRSAKKAIDLSIHNDRLLFSELLTSFYEVANLLNDRPIGYAPSDDNEISILTPNMLLLGRSSGTNPGGYQRPMETSVRSLVKLVQEVVDSFWNHWTELYAPTLLANYKWLLDSTPLKKDDVVLVADQNTVRGDYRVAIVDEVHPSKDGVIRRVSIRYVNYRTMTKKFELVGGQKQVVERSVQRLSLLVPS